MPVLSRRRQKSKGRRKKKIDEPSAPSFKSDACVLLLSLLILMAVLAITFRVILKQWSPGRIELVDPRECKCDCWDGLYRGQRLPRNFLSFRGSLSDYKFVYFNLEKQTLTIFLFAALYLHLFMIAITGFLNTLWYARKQLRVEMLLLFSASYYSNFYSFWAIFNYLNDGTGSKYFLAQIYYGFTELGLAYLTYRMHRRSRDNKGPEMLLVIQKRSVKIGQFEKLHLGVRKIYEILKEPKQVSNIFLYDLLFSSRRR